MRGRPHLWWWCHDHPSCNHVVSGQAISMNTLDAINVHRARISPEILRLCDQMRPGTSINVGHLKTLYCDLDLATRFIEELQQVGWLQRALELPRAKARLSHSRFIYVSLKKNAPCASRTRSDMSQSIIALLGSRLDDSERRHYSIIALRSESERRAMLFLDSAAAYK